MLLENIGKVNYSMKVFFVYLINHLVFSTLTIAAVWDVCTIEQTHGLPMEKPINNNTCSDMQIDRFYYIIITSGAQVPDK